MTSKLDPNQIIQAEFDEASGATKVVSVGGALVSAAYDTVNLTYILVGNGTGQVGTVTYLLGATLVATLTLSYDASNNLISVIKS